MRIDEMYPILHQGHERWCRLIIDHSWTQAVGHKQDHVVRWAVGEARYCRCENDRQAGDYRTKSPIAHSLAGICLDAYKQTNAAMHPLCAGSSAHLGALIASGHQLDGNPGHHRAAITCHMERSTRGLRPT
jgi:hypothetical protein